MGEASNSSVVGVGSYISTDYFSDFACTIPSLCDDKSDGLPFFEKKKKVDQKVKMN